jgi:hypothetical protein
VRLLSSTRWAATEAAAVHFLFIGAVGLVLLAAGFDAPKLPLLVVPAVALDLAVERRTGPVVCAAAFTAALYLAYVPSLNWLGEGVRLDVADVALGFPLAVGATALVFTAVFTAHRPARAAAAAAAAGVLLTLVPAGPALAHDPGQGEDAGSMSLVATTEAKRISLDAVLRGGRCEPIEQAALVARRGGRTIRAPLAQDGCRFRGRVTVDERGRWFVYAELRGAGMTIESWLPVKVDGSGRFVERDRYAYVADAPSSGAGKTLVGAALYLVMLMLVAGIIVLARAEVRRRVPAHSP